MMQKSFFELRFNCDAVFLVPYRYGCNLRMAVICLPLLTVGVILKLAFFVTFSATQSLKSCACIYP